MWVYFHNKIITETRSINVMIRCTLWLMTQEWYQAFSRFSLLGSKVKYAAKKAWGSGYLSITKKLVSS